MYFSKKALTNGADTAIINLFAICCGRGIMPKIDDALLARAQSGDESALAALIARIMPIIRKNAVLCEAPGMEFDDFVQEGLIGLFHAVRGYRADAGKLFTAYAAICIRNAQRDAQRAALRKKHAPLNYSTVVNEQDALSPGPEDLAIENERYAAALHKLQTELSTMERRALIESLYGRTTAQIAQLLNAKPKAIENALARARRKMRG